MLTAFWGSVSSKLADRFAATSGPALIFWLGGLLAWSYAHGGLHVLARPASWLGRQSTFTQVLVIVVVLVGVTASAVVVSRLTTPVLRLLEGYWPAWADPVRRRLVERVALRYADQDAAWQQVAVQLFGDADAAQPEAAGTGNADAARQAAIRGNLLARYGRLERARSARPSRAELYLPTRIGNILRAAETRPRDKYDLDSVAIWPRLWLALPDSTRQEVTAARTALDSAVAASVWGILFLLFIPWTVLALPIGLAVSAVAVLAWIPVRADIFGQLVVAAFDVHRTALYQQLRWPLPVSPQDEHLQGRRLSTYLQKGSDRPEPLFSQPQQ